MTNQLTRAQYEAEAEKRDRAIADASRQLDQARNAIPLDPDEAKVVEAAQAAALAAVQEAQNDRAKLEELWRASERKRLYDKAGLTAEKRNAAGNVVAAAAEQQSKAFSAIVEALSSVTQHVNAYREARAEIASTAREFSIVFANDVTSAAEQMRQFLEATNDTRQESDFLQAILFEANGAEFALGRHDAWLRKRDGAITVARVIERRLKLISQFLERLAAPIDSGEE